jgi:hypothetical protein
MFDHGICAKACNRRGWCVETEIRDLVTKTDPMEVSKRHIHYHCSTVILAMLRFIRCCTCHVYFNMRNEGSVFQNEISILRIYSGHFENSTVMRYASNCFLLYIKTDCHLHTSICTLTKEEN